VHVSTKTRACACSHAYCSRAAGVEVPPHAHMLQVWSAQRQVSCPSSVPAREESVTGGVRFTFVAAQVENRSLRPSVETLNRCRRNVVVQRATRQRPEWRRQQCNSGSDAAKRRKARMIRQNARQVSVIGNGVMTSCEVRMNRPSHNQRNGRPGMRIGAYSWHRESQP